MLEMSGDGATTRVKVDFTSAGRLRILKSPLGLEFGLRAYTCQQRQADFWKALKEALHGISRSVETGFLARLARLPVPVEEEQSVCLARG